jgi:hypothetical protein
MPYTSSTYGNKIPCKFWKTHHIIVVGDNNGNEHCNDDITNYVATMEQIVLWTML